MKAGGVVAYYYNLLQSIKAPPGCSWGAIWWGRRFCVSLQKVNLKRYIVMSIDDFNNVPLGYAAASINHYVAVLFPPHPPRSWGCAAVSLAPIVKS